MKIEADRHTAQGVIAQPDAWVPISDAPLEVEGIIWTPEAPTRNDIHGTVGKHYDGERYVHGPWSGLHPTLWHPLPPLPSPPRV